MQAGVRYGIVGTVCAAVVGLVSVTSASAQQSQVERGKYLVTLGSCTDCHTPGYFFGKPDLARYLGGSEVGFEIPGLGVFHGPNLTPGSETGLGNWTIAQIVTAFRPASDRTGASSHRSCRGARSRT